VTNHIRLAVAGLICSAFAAHASAQQLRFDVDEPDGNSAPVALAVYDEPIYFSVAGGFAHQFSSDLMTGDYNVSRFDFAVSAESPVNESWNVALTFRTLVDSFDFAPTASLGLGSAPWEDIYTLSFGARVQVKLNDKWKLSGGPVVQFSRESGADWSDSATVGGTISAIYQWNDNLAIGFGVGVISQIEDDALIIPVLTIEWTITDTLRLVSGSPTATGVGAELIWEFAPTFELALGAGYSSKRFRLDDMGIAPGGVGEENYFPLSLRLGWKPNDHVEVSLTGGFTFGTELTLETSAGARITQEEPDGAMFAGLSARIQF
jgi:hypothetical protein